MSQLHKSAAGRHLVPPSADVTISREGERAAKIILKSQNNVTMRLQTA
jgi:hypothetical protein